ncbi:MAG TPA: hypothetical protein VF742_00880, partial [Terracidiphilus sp.]
CGSLGSIISSSCDSIHRGTCQVDFAESGLLGFQFSGRPRNALGSGCGNRRAQPRVLSRVAGTGCGFCGARMKGALAGALETGVAFELEFG